MIRHSKWHQKMEEAFKYGFRRVTPADDCSDHFQDCQHNKKQTHYHCVQSEGCDKVSKESLDRDGPPPHSTNKKNQFLARPYGPSSHTCLKGKAIFALKYVTRVKQ